MDPVKKAAVTNWPVPESRRQVESFLGFANFYRWFLWDYGKTVAPLTVLTSCKVLFPVVSFGGQDLPSHSKECGRVSFSYFGGSQLKNKLENTSVLVPYVPRTRCPGTHQRNINVTSLPCCFVFLSPSSLSLCVCLQVSHRWTFVLHGLLPVGVASAWLNCCIFKLLLSKLFLCYSIAVEFIYVY